MASCLICSCGMWDNNIRLTVCHWNQTPEPKIIRTKQKPVRTLCTQCMLFPHWLVLGLGTAAQEMFCFRWWEHQIQRACSKEVIGSIGSAGFSLSSALGLWASNPGQEPRLHTTSLLWGWERDNGPCRPPKCNYLPQRHERHWLMFDAGLLLLRF